MITTASIFFGFLLRKLIDPARIRTWNPLNRSQIRYPMGHGATHSTLFISCMLSVIYKFTTVFVDTRLWTTKQPGKRFQNFRQSCLLLTDRIEIQQTQPDSMT